MTSAPPWPRKNMSGSTNKIWAASTTSEGKWLHLGHVLSSDVWMSAETAHADDDLKPFIPTFIVHSKGPRLPQRQRQTTLADTLCVFLCTHFAWMRAFFFFLFVAAARGLCHISHAPMSHNNTARSHAKVFPLSLLPLLIFFLTASWWGPWRWAA